MKEYKKRIASVEWDITSEDCLDINIDSTFNLPTKVEIPPYVEEDKIADWLSDEYGFCVLGYTLNEY